MTRLFCREFFSQFACFAVRLFALTSFQKVLTMVESILSQSTNYP